eukprot:CFRG4594T1
MSVNDNMAVELLTMRVSAMEKEIAELVADNDRLTMQIASEKINTAAKERELAFMKRMTLNSGSGSEPAVPPVATTPRDDAEQGKTAVQIMSTLSNTNMVVSNTLAHTPSNLPVFPRKAIRARFDNGDLQTRRLSTQSMRFHSLTSTDKHERKDGKVRKRCLLCCEKCNKNPHDTTPHGAQNGTKVAWTCNYCAQGDADDIVLSFGLCEVKRWIMVDDKYQLCTKEEGQSNASALSCYEVHHTCETYPELPAHSRRQRRSIIPPVQAQAHANKQVQFQYDSDIASHYPQTHVRSSQEPTVAHAEDVGMHDKSSTSAHSGSIAYARIAPSAQNIADSAQPTSTTVRASTHTKLAYTSTPTGLAVRDVTHSSSSVKENTVDTQAACAVGNGHSGGTHTISNSHLNSAESSSNAQNTSSDTSRSTHRIVCGTNGSTHAVSTSQPNSSSICASSTQSTSTADMSTSTGLMGCDPSSRAHREGLSPARISSRTRARPYPPRGIDKGRETTKI